MKICRFEYRIFIVLSAFITNFIVDGLCFSYGVFLTEIGESFEGGKYKMILAGSSLTGIFLLTCPLSDLMSQRFSYRIVIVTGTGLAFTGIFFSGFIYDINLFIVVFGVIGGTGLGLIYQAANIQIPIWFPKNCTIPCGISVCGSACGGSVYSLLTAYLIDKYTWRGALIIIAAIQLHTLICAALIRKKNIFAEHIIEIEGDKPDDKIVESMFEIEIVSSEYDIYRQRSLVGKLLQEEKNKRRVKKGLLLSTLSMLTMDITDGNSIVFKDSSARTNFIRNCRSNAYEKKSDYDWMKNNICLYLLLLSSAFTFVGYYCPYQFLLDHCITTLKIHHLTAPFIMTYMGIVNMAFRILSGVFIHYISGNYSSATFWTNNISLLIGGFTLVMIPFGTTFLHMTLIMSIHGAALAAFNTLRMSLIIDIFGKKHLSAIFSFNNACYGLATFVSPPGLAIFFDWNNNYDYTFYLSGSAILIAGLLCLPMRYLSKKYKIYEI